MRAAFVYQNARRPLLAAVARGEEPDTTLLGANHLAAEGIEAVVHDPLLTRRQLRPPLGRLAWNARELTVPWEVGRADVVFTPLAALFPLAARARRRLGIVVVDYGLNLIWRRASPARRRLLRASLRSADRVVCLGESQRAQLAEWGVVDESKLETLLVPVDAAWFTAAPPGGRTVLSVGKDLARDFGTLARAAETLDARVDVVAHPRNVAGLELPRNVRVRSGIAARELRDAYARAGCVVLPQRADSYGYGSEGGGLTALLEAMASARPIVATGRAILRDYVTDGVDALVVPPEDPAALREAVARVLGDPELAARLGAAARARVERAHTTPGFARQLAPLLRLACRA